jgi:SAM-dependent methyltransferase
VFLNPKNRVTSLPGRASLVQAAPACKCCGAATGLQGVVDFGKACSSNFNGFFPLTGIPIYYHRCLSCGFLFTTDFDSWSFQDFADHIYNDDYALVDAEYGSGARQRRDVPVVRALVARYGARRVLDYGGGNGTLARELRGHGVDAVSWDPLADGPEKRPEGTFDLVTAFEVVEHTPTPVETAAEMVSFLAPGARIALSTNLADDLGTQNMDWWYIAPRNGHISIHTQASLRALFARFGHSMAFGGPWIVEPRA